MVRARYCVMGCARPGAGLCSRHGVGAPHGTARSPVRGRSHLTRRRGSRATLEVLAGLCLRDRPISQTPSLSGLSHRKSCGTRRDSNKSHWDAKVPQKILYSPHRKVSSACFTNIIIATLSPRSLRGPLPPAPGARGRRLGRLCSQRPPCSGDHGTQRVGGTAARAPLGPALGAPRGASLLLRRGPRATRVPGTPFLLWPVFPGPLFTSLI